MENDWRTQATAGRVPAEEAVTPGTLRDAMVQAQAGAAQAQAQIARLWQEIVAAQEREAKALAENAQLWQEIIRLRAELKIPS